MVDTEKPAIKPGHALIRIKRIGICGTDIHAYSGVQPFFRYPRVLGHELSGVIEEIGINENDWNVHDKVAIIPYHYCGDCKACKRGKTNCCQALKVTGVHIDGGMQEYMTVPISHLVKVNDLSYDEAALMEPLAIGAHAVRRSGMNKSDTIAVVGAGPIGLGIMLFAKELGATVISVDMNTNRLQFCKEWLRIEDTVDAHLDPILQVEKITAGHMADIVFDATGNKHSMEQSFEYSSFGGKVVYVGLIEDNIQFYDPDFHKRETTLMGSRNATREDFEHVYKVLRTRKYNMQKYITHRFLFENMIQDFPESLKADSTMIKALVEV